jgi:hypothetical protein
MSRPPKPDGSKLEDWIEPLTLRGRWGRVDSSNKGFVDRGTVEDVASAFATEFGLRLENIREGPDPPDILACIEDRDVSIELVEFLKESVREKEVKKLPVSFDEKLWTREAVIEKLNYLLDKKQAVYARRSDGFVADALLIHSCELWLDAGDVEQWLEGVVFEPRKTIRAAYFVMEHLPNDPKSHWPLFRLYGDL